MARYTDVKWTVDRMMLGHAVEIGIGPADWQGHRWYYSIDGNEVDGEPAATAADAARWARDFIEEHLAPANADP